MTRPTLSLIAIPCILLALVATAVEASEPRVEIGPEPNRIDRIEDVLVGLPPWHGDVETPAHRRIRLRRVAIAIVVAARGDRELEALLIEQGRAETHYARHIGEGRCGEHPKSPPRECDNGKARGYWQAHRPPAMSLARWDALRGTSQAATTAAAELAARALRQGRASCGRVVGPLRGAFSVAATGSSCRWSGAEARAKRARGWLGRI